jgi:hypothetical protein
VGFYLGGDLLDFIYLFIYFLNLCMGCRLWGFIWDEICQIFFKIFFFLNLCMGCRMWGSIWGGICPILFIIVFFLNLCVGCCFLNFFLIVLVLLNWSLMKLRHFKLLIFYS